MSKRVKIAYFEDLKVVKEGVNFLLSQYKEYDIIESDFDPDLAEEFIAETRPDVLILDLQLQMRQEGEPTNGFEICGMVKQKYPDIKLIAHSIYDSVENVNKFFAQGGMAFVSKKSGHQELVNAINHVIEGKKYLSKEVIRQSKNSDKFLSGDEPLLKANNELFTRAEKSVLEKIAKGFSTKQIAQQLQISEKTVETHRKHLFDKAGVKNVAELMAFVYSRRMFID